LTPTGSSGSISIKSHFSATDSSQSQSRLGNVIPLASRTNAWGLKEDIDFVDRICFNPSLLSLPFTDSNPDNNATFVMVVRDLDNTVFVEEGNYFTGTRSISAWLLQGPQIAGNSRYRWSPMERFANQAHSFNTLETVVTADEQLFPPGTTAVVENYCRSIAGPEDPRIFWSHLGEPLLMYNSIGAFNSIHCRHIYLVDLRSVYPGLNDTLAHNFQSPIRFRNSTPLIYPGQQGLQKNWAPFTDATGQIYVHTDLVPQRIYKIALPENNLPGYFSPGTELNILQPVIASSSPQNCVTKVLDLHRYAGENSSGDGEKSTDDPNVLIHQSTPFLEVVLCTSTDVLSGSCDEQDPRNRIYLGIFHVLHSPDQRPRYYERRVITLNSIPPFEYISISKPLIYRMTPLVFR
jgi:hypothetical protein